MWEGIWIRINDRLSGPLNGNNVDVDHQSYLLLAHRVSSLLQPLACGLVYTNRAMRENRAGTGDTWFKCNVGSSCADGIEEGQPGLTRTCICG